MFLSSLSVFYLQYNMLKRLSNGYIHLTPFQDKKSVESTCLCFARLVDNFQHEEVGNSFFCFVFFRLDTVFCFCVCHLCVVSSICHAANVCVCACVSMFKSTEPAAGGCITGPVDQHSATAGSDPSCTQLGDVHHGCAHVFPHVLQLPLLGSPTYETE